jgi:hypothetical protein
LCFVLVAGLAGQGCGGGAGSKSLGSQSTVSAVPPIVSSSGGSQPAPATTSTITVVAASTTMTHSATITLTLQ